MPFYKKESNTLFSGDCITNSSFYLCEETKNDYTYPVDGWYWFATEQEAMATIVDPLREANKITKQALVDAIKVTTQSGRTFDGDEVSQGRISRAIFALNETGQRLIQWILSDNSVEEVSAEDLSEALSLSVLEQARIWTV